MKLHYAGPSPFVRKVLVTAHEAGFADKIDRVPTGTFLPIEPHDGVIADNPLGKIPAMVLDDGTALYDSRVICEYLATEGSGDLLPATGAARWTALRLQALGQGLSDAGVALRYETAMRPAERQWDQWIDAQRARIARSVDALNGDDFGDLGDVTLGTIAVAVALSYLDFRFEDIKWRDGRERLAEWYAAFAQRPSMTATELNAQM